MLRDIREQKQYRRPGREAGRWENATGIGC